MVRIAKELFVEFTITGMQPVLFSVTEAAGGRSGWVRSGYNICYYRNEYADQEPRSKNSKGKNRLKTPKTPGRRCLSLH